MQSQREQTEATPERDERVPGKGHYGWKYLSGARAHSYAHQLAALADLAPDSVVEIGPGPGVVTGAVRQMGTPVTTVDVQDDLSPDVVASVLDLPFEDDAFDVALCCQVLEHLPLDDFGGALSELRRVSRRGLLLSLPDCTAHYEVTFRLPKLGQREWTRARQHALPERYIRTALEKAGHYWEIGYEVAPLRVITAAIGNAGFVLERTWRVRELPYHRFFLCAAA